MPFIRVLVQNEQSRIEQKLNPAHLIHFMCQYPLCFVHHWGQVKELNKTNTHTLHVRYCLVYLQDQIILFCRRILIKHNQYIENMLGFF